jgi:hypothetical protein
MEMQGIIEILAEMKADRKADREALNKMNAKIDANQAKAIKQEEILANISLRMNANLKDQRE